MFHAASSTNLIRKGPSTSGSALAPATRGTVVLLGNLSVEHPRLDPLVEEIGWSLKRVESFDQLRDSGTGEQGAAVLLDAIALRLSWVEAVKSVLEASSMALPIVCHRFSDRIAWPELAGAGAFHALLLPLDPGELRQSLGFVSAARSHHFPNVVPMRPAEREKGQANTHNVARRAGSAA